MKWKKEKLRDNDGKQIPCWRTDCGEYLIYLNLNKGIVRKGEVDKHGHMWWYQLCKVPDTKPTIEIQVSDEKYIGMAPTLSESKKLALLEAEPEEN